MIVSKLYELIEKGKEGNNIGISTDMPRFDKATYGIQRGTMTVIAGDTGAGKSTLALWRQVYSPIKHAIENNLNNVHILYYSFEMASELLLAKLLSLHIYDTYGVVASHEKILSFTEIISPDLYYYVKESKDWLNLIENKFLSIEDGKHSAGSLYSHCKKWCLKYGTAKETILNEGTKYEKKYTTYTPEDINQYLIVVIDHIKLLKVTKPSTREEIEAASNYLIALRNKYKISPCIVQQLNRNSKKMDRKMNGFEMLGLDDLSDSSAPSQAAEQVIGIFYPHRELIPKCLDYEIKTEMKDRFRALQILKNRYGRSDLAIGVGFYGEIGYWKELPRAEHMKISDYQEYKNLQENDNLEQEDKSNNQDDNKITFTF